MPRSSIVKCMLVWMVCPIVQQNSAPLSFTQLDITEKLFLAALLATLLTLSPYVTACFKWYPDTVLCDSLCKTLWQRSPKPKKCWPSIPSDYRMVAVTSFIMWTFKSLFAQQLRPCKISNTQREVPIFILIPFHYQSFLLVSEPIVFPDRLWAEEDLDSTAGRQPMLKMHGLVWGASNYVSVKPNVLCICKVDSPIIFSVFLLWWDRANV